MIRTLEQRHYTLEEYEQLAECGVLGPEDHIELIEGEIVSMSPIGLRHRRIVDELIVLFAPLLTKKQTILSIQNPLRVPPDSEPEPDCQLLRPEMKRARRHPSGADVFLVIEVSESTLRHDRDVKMPLYASAGVPEFWIVDLDNNRLEVYRQPVPTERRYQSVRTLLPGETIAPEAFPDLELEVAEIIGA